MTMGIEALSFKLEVLYAKSVHYTVGSTITTFAQILLLISQMHSTSTPGSAMRVSILSVSQQATIDAYLCLLHLTAGSRFSTVHLHVCLIRLDCVPRIRTPAGLCLNKTTCT